MEIITNGGEKIAKKKTTRTRRVYVKRKGRRRKTAIGILEMATAVSAIPEATNGQILKGPITDAVRTFYSDIQRKLHLPSQGIGGAISMVAISQVVKKIANQTRMNPGISIGGFRIRLF